MSLGNRLIHVCYDLFSSAILGFQFAPFLRIDYIMSCWISPLQTHAHTTWHSRLLFRTHEGRMGMGETVIREEGRDAQLGSGRKIHEK